MIKTKWLSFDLLTLVCDNIARKTNCRSFSYLLLFSLYLPGKFLGLSVFGGYLSMFSYIYELLEHSCHNFSLYLVKGSGSLPALCRAVGWLHNRLPFWWIVANCGPVLLYLKLTMTPYWSLNGYFIDFLTALFRQGRPIIAPIHYSCYWRLSSQPIFLFDCLSLKYYWYQNKITGLDALWSRVLNTIKFEM